MEPQAAEYPSSGVNFEPGISNVCTFRILVLDCTGLLPRFERCGTTRDAGRGERLSGIRYDKRIKGSSSDILLACANECLDQSSLRIYQLSDLFLPSSQNLVTKADKRDAY
jgi:hypothetical protein